MRATQRGVVGRGGRRVQPGGGTMHAVQQAGGICHNGHGATQQGLLIASWVSQEVPPLKSTTVAQTGGQGEPWLSQGGDSVEPELSQGLDKVTARLSQHKACAIRACTRFTDQVTT